MERLCDSSEVPAGQMKSFRLGQEEIMLANVGGTFYAIKNRCTHMGCPLARGTLNGKVVTCPCHGSKFDVTTGAVVGPPASVPEPAFEVVLDGGSVMVKARGT